MLLLSPMQRSDSTAGRSSRLLFSVPALLLGSSLALSACSPSDVVSPVTGADSSPEYMTPYGIVPSDNWVNGFEEIQAEEISNSKNILPVPQAFGPYTVLHRFTLDGKDEMIGFKWTGEKLEKIWESVSPIIFKKHEVSYKGRFVFDPSLQNLNVLDLETGKLSNLEWKSPFTDENGEVPLNEMDYVKDFHSDLAVYCEPIPDEYDVDFSQLSVLSNITVADVTRCAAFDFDSVEPKWVFDGPKVASTIPDDKVMVLDLQTGNTSLVNQFIGFRSHEKKLQHKVIFKGKFPKNYRLGFIDTIKLRVEEDFSITSSERESTKSGLQFESNRECKLADGNMKTLHLHFDAKDQERITLEAPKIPVNFKDSFLCTDSYGIGNVYSPKAKKLHSIYADAEKEAHLLYSPNRKVASLVLTEGVAIRVQTVFDNLTGEFFGIDQEAGDLGTIKKEVNLLTPDHGLILLANESTLKLTVVKAKDAPDEESKVEESKVEENDPHKYENEYFTLNIPDKLLNMNWEVSESSIDVEGQQVTSFELRYSTTDANGIRGGGYEQIAVFPPGATVPAPKYGFDRILGTTSTGYTLKVMTVAGAGVLATNNQEAERYVILTLK